MEAAILDSLFFLFLGVFSFKKSGYLAFPKHSFD
jgi:hypothetical protein